MIRETSMKKNNFFKIQRHLTALPIHTYIILTTFKEMWWNWNYKPVISDIYKKKSRFFFKAHLFFSLLWLLFLKALRIIILIVNKYRVYFTFHFVTVSKKVSSIFTLVSFYYTKFCIFVVIAIFYYLIYLQ